jgi:hypothetical protein
MSDPDTKVKKSKRLSKTHDAIEKQVRIAKAMGMNHMLEQPHRLAKHHALDCGNPECLVCHSEKVFRKPTIQEKKFIDGNNKDAQNDCKYPD